MCQAGAEAASPSPRTTRLGKAARGFFVFQPIWLGAPVLGLCRFSRRRPLLPESNSRDRRSFGDEPLKGEIFYTHKEAKVLIEQWRHHYNTIRPHRALDDRLPVPEAIQHYHVDLSCALDGLQTDRRFRQAARSLN